MTVVELRKALEQFAPNAEVCFPLGAERYIFTVDHICKTGDVVILSEGRDGAKQYQEMVDEDRRNNAL